MLQRLRLCRASDTVFRREIDSQRQWGYGTCYGDSFPAAKECKICMHCARNKTDLLSGRITYIPIPYIPIVANIICIYNNYIYMCI